MAESIRRFAQSVGATRKYHHTVTIAWMRLVYGAMLPQEVDFTDFLQRNPQLSDKETLARFYSRRVLASDAARNGWIGPDVAPLPATGENRDQTAAQRV